MIFIDKDEGELYVPEGHDEQVSSRSLWKNHLDCHVTTFAPGAGMIEEVHEHDTHIFYMLEGFLDVRQNGRLLRCLGKGDTVVIEAGEPHEIFNSGKTSGVFLAITFPSKRVDG